MLLDKRFKLQLCHSERAMNNCISPNDLDVNIIAIQSVLKRNIVVFGITEDWKPIFRHLKSNASLCQSKFGSEKGR